MNQQNRNIGNITLPFEWKPKWYYVAFPFLPRFINNTSLRLFTVLWRDCSYVAISIGTPHFFDVFIKDPSLPWYKKEIVGFQIWY